jgi:hypothetical protein
VNFGGQGGMNWDSLEMGGFFGGGEDMICEVLGRFMSM